MKSIAKLAAGAILACGLAASATAPAGAAVRFGVGIGIGAPVVVPPAAYSCYDAYGNYAYWSPYCTAQSVPYVAPQVHLSFGDRDRGHGAFVDHNRDHQSRIFRGDDHGDRGGRGRG